MLYNPLHTILKKPLILEVGKKVDEWANYPKWMEDHHQERVKECKEDEEKFGPVEYADEESEDIPF